LRQWHLRVATLNFRANFVPRGGGLCSFMDCDPPDAWTGMEAFRRGLAAEPPRAVVVISAPWEEAPFMVDAAA
jgi:hypothetical protein